MHSENRGPCLCFVERNLLDVMLGCCQRLARHIKEIYRSLTCSGGSFVLRTLEAVKKHYVRLINSHHIILITPHQRHIFRIISRLHSLLDGVCQRGGRCRDGFWRGGHRPQHQTAQGHHRQKPYQAIPERQSERCFRLSRRRQGEEGQPNERGSGLITSCLAESVAAGFPARPTTSRNGPGPQVSRTGRLARRPALGPRSRPPGRKAAPPPVPCGDALGLTSPMGAETSAPRAALMPRRRPRSFPPVPD